jgi:C4-dicarboxylate-specific signal transduction histidine kinase
MAEVATGVLHNVGNVLNSVNVSIELMRERAAAHPIGRVRQLQELLASVDPASFDATRLAATRRYVEVVARSLERAHEATVADLETLRAHVDHIKRVVAMQNAYARRGGIVEDTHVRALIDEAIELACPASRRAHLALEVDTVDAPAALDRSRAVQILVNLITNARDAVTGVAHPSIKIRARRDGEALIVSVADNGKGWAREVGDQLFGAGFTTKAHGHGYGLHSAALAARQMGGTLCAHSEGPGLGATFTLTIDTTPRGSS